MGKNLEEEVLGYPDDLSFTEEEGPSGTLVDTHGVGEGEVEILKWLRDIRRETGEKKNVNKGVDKSRRDEKR